ncbi:DUF86 domain-containing protein [Candidatus Poriferisocius sp.]|uniref:HepT-like ribonuclease domain-containing protein n=1 Tax=Candidatus Poriferisocius sp. TaxID=3101276 RepID=UPI003B02C0B8
MTRRDDERIQDILEACGRLAEIAVRGRPAYDGDWVLRDAANYNLTVIGEALDSLSDEFVARHPDLPVRQAKSLRNKLTHEYFVADSDILWDTITQDVPDLATQFAAIRNAAGQ